MTAMFMGASYANGCVFFAAVLAGKKWHRVWAPHVGVFMFATLLFIATLLHWDKFSHSHPVFWAWIFIYAVAPILVPIAIFRNLPEDPGTPEPRDAVVPLLLRRIWLIPGALFFCAAIAAFINPAWLMPHWPWKTSPLTMRVIAAFYSMLGVAVFTVLRETRWSAWRIGAIGVTVWHALIVVAALFRKQDFSTQLVGHWWFSFEVALLAGVAFTFVLMELRASKAHASSQ
jgi:hypothetical protein